jgi:hypothetical protein
MAPDERITLMTLIKECYSPYLTRELVNSTWLLIKRKYLLFLVNESSHTNICYLFTNSNSGITSCLSISCPIYRRSWKIYPIWMWVWPKKHCAHPIFYTIFLTSYYFYCVWYRNCITYTRTNYTNNCLRPTYHIYLCSIYYCTNCGINSRMKWRISWLIKID